MKQAYWDLDLIRLSAENKAVHLDNEFILIDNLDETSVEVIKNIDGTYYNKNDNIKEILEKHIISPVRFDKAIKLMQEEKVDEYVEIGPRKNFNRFC